MTSDTAPTLTGLTPAERERVAQLIQTVTCADHTIARFEAAKARALAELAGIAHASGERSPNRDGIDYARRAMAADVAAATHTHPAAAKHAMEEAEILTSRFPATFDALAGGTISAKHARVIAESGGALDPDMRARFDEIAVPVAENMTPGELSRIAKKRAAEMADLSPRERHRRARERRFVSITDLDDGMSTLRMNGPSLELHGVYDRLTKLAKIVKHDRAGVREDYRKTVGHAVGAKCVAEGCACRTIRDAAETVSPASNAATADSGARTGSSSAAGMSTGATLGGTHAADADEADTRTDGKAANGRSAPLTPGPLPPEAVTAATDHRTLDQLRTDLFIDLLLGAEPTGHELHSAGTDASLTKIHADVQITIPATMILDPDDGAAWLDAGTLISPDAARTVAGSTPGWDRLFYRPDTGQVEQVDHYRPTAWQKRSLIGRDLTCRFPGCTTPARRADIDHTHAFAEGGGTTMSNLACLCEAHHVMKHQSDWQMRQLDDGVIEWTSPSGYTYETEPPSRVFFQEHPEPESPSSLPPPPSPDDMWDAARENAHDPTDPPPWASG